MNRKVREYLASALYFAVLAMALVWRQLLNRLSCGVVVSKGEHRVRFAYRPDSYRRAFFAFFPSFALMLGLLAFPVVTHYRSKSGE